MHRQRVIRFCVCAAILIAGAGVLRAQTFKTIRSFTYPSLFPFGRLLCTNNVVYGTGGSGAYGYGSIFRVNSDGTGFTTLKSFPPTYAGPNGTSTNSDGATPLGGLVIAGQTLYGTASAGGAFGKGAVFSIRIDGSAFTVLRHFAGTDGKSPYAELLLNDNVLYGTTAAGGVSNKGAVFRLKTDGSEFAVLKSFFITDGLLPLGPLVLATDTLYGTTYHGGAFGQGTVFSLRTDGSDFIVLKDFSGPDGANPRFNLVLCGNSLYGTTEGNGDLNNSLVFKLNTDGSEFAVLKSFSEPDPVTGINDDGFSIRSGLCLSGGTLYGTTREGGQSADGVIFALRTDGSTYTVLHHFSSMDSNGRNSDGAVPLPSLNSSGPTLFGATQYGGSFAEGTMFSLNFAPRILVNDGSFGVQGGGFGFNVTGYSNQTLIIEACTNLASPLWSALETNTISSGPLHFVDQDWSNHGCRFYRIRAD